MFPLNPQKVKLFEGGSRATKLSGSQEGHRSLFLRSPYFCFTYPSQANELHKPDTRRVFPLLAGPQPYGGHGQVCVETSPVYGQGSKWEKSSFSRVEVGKTQLFMGRNGQIQLFVGQNGKNRNGKNPAFHGSKWENKPGLLISPQNQHRRASFS